MGPSAVVTDAGRAPTERTRTAGADHAHARGRRGVAEPGDCRVPRALLADDEPLIRRALAAQLKREFSIVALAGDADRAISLAAKHHPDVALLDVEMPGGGLHATRLIHERSPETAIVILTSDDSRSSVLQYLDAGAVAYLRKGMAPQQLVARLLEAITAHKALVHHDDRRRKAADDRFHAAFDQAAVGMAIVALEGEQAGTLIAANAAYATMIGWEPAELVGANFEQWTHPDDLPEGTEDPLASLARGGAEPGNFEQRYLNRRGGVVNVLATAASFVDEDGRRVAIVQVLDITERTRMEAELEYAVDHDSLTGLFNRKRFLEEVQREVDRAGRYTSRGAVLVLDLDGFKSVNDSFGHAAGDELVASLGHAMASVLRSSDMVARTGGDEFAIILPEADERAALGVARKLLEAVRLGGTVLRGGHIERVTASIGIAVFDGCDDPTVDALMIEADIAMYDAKAAGKDQTAVYQPGERREHVMIRRSDVRRLRDAVEHSHFVLHAQPIVPVCSNGVPRFELLLRMNGENGALIAPGAFLADAERSALILPIDRWVMSQAVSMLHDYHAAGSDISLAINVSGRTLNSGAIVDHLRKLLETHEIPEGRLVLELTETVAISNVDSVRNLARDLRSLGCRIALDDFGAGFATFFYLKHLDFDYIKIDGEFIKALPRTHADQLVVHAVVEIARGFHSDTIAEFVQDDETLLQLRELGVGYAQGYHTGRPGPLADVLPPCNSA